MRVYVIPDSAYARIARVVLIEKGLDGRVDVAPAQSSAADSAYYAICPLDRVPYLGCRAAWSAGCLGPDNTQVSRTR
jgi:glutathione S-transferase